MKVTFREESVKINQDDSGEKEQMVAAFMREFSSISFLGITSAYNIKPTVAYDLLNLSLFFRKENLHLSANEVDVCLSLALANEQKVRHTVTARWLKPERHWLVASTFRITVQTGSLSTYCA